MVNLLGLPIRVAEEVISAVPALVDRTRSQLELTQHLLEKLPCSPLHRGTAAESSTSREATQDAAGNEGAHATVTDIRSHQNPAPADADVEDQTVPDASEVATPVASISALMRLATRSVQPVLLPKKMPIFAIKAVLLRNVVKRFCG